MTFKKIKPFPYLLPKPVAIVGAIVDHKPTFLTIADLSTSGYATPRFIISSGRHHYTNQGIIENNEFSVNIPSEQIVMETDYVGIKSGTRVDKSNVFTIFYGENLKFAPMIEEAPITHACKLVKTVDFGDTHYIFIGEITETYVNEDVFSTNIPDIEKVKPFSFYYDNFYRNYGEKVAQAYKIGRKYGK